MHRTTASTEPTNGHIDRTSAITKLLLWLSIIGALNWGLVGFFNWNLVSAIFGGETSAAYSTLSRVIFALVGLCGLALAFFVPRLREVHPVVQRRAAVRP